MRPLTLLLGLGLLAGCSSSGEGVVRGRVTLDGEPAAGVIVRFNPKDDLRLGASWARTADDGRFEVPLGEHPGRTMHPGTFCVSIATAPDEGPGGAARTRVPARYAEPDKPAFTVEIRPGANELPPFDLEGR